MGYFKKLLVALVVLVLAMDFPLRYQLNNACKDYDSFLNLYFSKNCYFTPDNHDDTLSIIQRYTGLGETHEVLTEDGYYLTLHRIPKKNPKGVILFQHGVSHDSRFFVAQQNNSISFYFWRAGYDVWLINNRGSTYSQRHVNLTIENEEFWNFSFSEIGKYDVSSSIKYVKNVTKVEKIIFVGLSVGASVGSIYALSKPEEAESSVKLLVNLAPFYFTTKMTSTVKHLFFVGTQILNYKVNRMLNWYYFLDHDSWYMKIIRGLNRIYPFKTHVLNLVQGFGGGEKEKFDPELFNLMFDQMASPTSLKMFGHLYQLTESKGRFQEYDYGPERNLEIYGSQKPLEYPLENLTVPVYMVYGEKDTLVPPEDAETLFERFPKKMKFFGKSKVKGFGHQDFVFGIDMNAKVYKKVLEVLDKIKG